MFDDDCGRVIRYILCASGALWIVSSYGSQIAVARGMGHQNQQQQQYTPTVPPPTPDDALVTSPTPPPKDAKLITKVGWCEVQVFGHSFSDAGLVAASLPMAHMHMLQRLEQVSRKVQFEPGKSGIQLMDDVDALVQFVYANKKAAASKAVPAQAAPTQKQ